MGRLILGSLFILAIIIGVLLVIGSSEPDDQPLVSNNEVRIAEAKVQTLEKEVERLRLENERLKTEVALVEAEGQLRISTALAESIRNNSETVNDGARKIQSAGWFWTTGKWILFMVVGSVILVVSSVIATITVIFRKYDVMEKIELNWKNTD